jgi:hypothetical protein
MYSGNRHKERLKKARVKRRVTLYESPNIIECRDANDVLGYAPGCRRRYWFRKQGEPVLAPINADYALEFQQDWIAHLYQQKYKTLLHRPTTITFSRRLPYMAILPDRILASQGRTEKEVLWTPVIIEVMTEPQFRVFEHNGISDRQSHILQFCLAVKKGVEKAVMIGGCMDPLEIKAVVVARQPDVVAEIEAAVERMFDSIRQRREPGGTTGECEWCPYFRRCCSFKPIGVERPDLELLTEEWMRARLREGEAAEGMRAIEDQIRHKMREIEEAHCDAGNLTYSTVLKWRVDTERLLAEKPDIVRLYRKNMPERVLRISR